MRRLSSLPISNGIISSCDSWTTLLITFFRAVFLNNLDLGKPSDDLYLSSFYCVKLVRVIEYFGGLKLNLLRIVLIVFSGSYLADDYLLHYGLTSDDLLNDWFRDLSTIVFTNCGFFTTLVLEQPNFSVLVKDDLFVMNFFSVMMRRWGPEFFKGLLGTR